MYEPIILSQQEVPEVISYEEILKLRIFPSDVIPMPEIIMSFKDVMVMTRKNISCITGKAKVGKTFLLTLLTQNILQKGEMNDFLKSYLPKGRDKIIYIDTEQADYHILLILKRIKDFVGANKIDNLMMFNFDAVDIEKRRAYTRELIYKTEGVGLVIIDGIADLVYDTNDIRESNVMVSDLRKWSVETNVHILNILHQNPSESTKMRGHLGSILTNKSETVIQITTSIDSESIKLVETLQTRNKKPEDFVFRITDEGKPEIMIEDISQFKTTGKKTPKDDKPDYQLYQICTSIYSKCTDEIKHHRYGELIQQIILEFEKQFNEKIGQSVAKNLLTKFIDKSWILKSGDKGFSQYFLGEFDSGFL